MVIFNFKLQKFMYLKFFELRAGSCSTSNYQRACNTWQLQGKKSSILSTCISFGWKICGNWKCLLRKAYAFYFVSGFSGLFLILITLFNVFSLCVLGCSGAWDLVAPSALEVVGNIVRWGKVDQITVWPSILKPPYTLKTSK